MILRHAIIDTLLTSIPLACEPPHRSMPLTEVLPSFDTDATDSSRIRLAGQWTLATALQVAEQLREVPKSIKAIVRTTPNCASTRSLLKFKELINGTQESRRQFT